MTARRPRKPIVITIFTKYAGRLCHEIILSMDGGERSAVTLRVRLIKSFEYRNIKFLTVKDVSLDMLVSDLITLINTEIQNSTHLPLPFKRHKFDTLKIHSHAHGAKTSDTAINLDNEQWILEPNRTLRDSDIRHETELSYFIREEYEHYKRNPQLLW